MVALSSRQQVVRHLLDGQPGPAVPDQLIDGRSDPF